MAAMPRQSAAGLKRPYAPHLPAEERREQLLDVALAIIDELGVPGVTVQRVAQRADVTPPVVYGQFKDAAEILRTLLDRETQRALEQLVPMLPDLSTMRDPVEVTVQAARAFLQAVVDEPLRWHTILLPIGQNPGAVRRRLEHSRALIRSQMEPLFAWGLEQRHVQHDIDVDLLARFVLAGLEEAGRVALTDPDAYPPERLIRFVEAFTTQFFDGTPDPAD